MRGPHEAEGKLRAELDGRFDFDRFEVLQAILRFFERVERQRRSVLGRSFLVVERGIFFLQVSGVGQNDRAQIDGRWCGVDGAVEAFFHQPRNPAAVVEMRVGEYDCINLAGGDRCVLPVAFAPLLRALKQAAVDQRLESLFAA